MSTSMSKELTGNLNATHSGDAPLAYQIKYINNPTKDQHLIPKLARKQDQPNVNQMTVTI